MEKTRIQTCGGIIPFQAFYQFFKRLTILRENPGGYIKYQREPRPLPREVWILRVGSVRLTESQNHWMRLVIVEIVSQEHCRSETCYLLERKESFKA
ncbi:hypothetical protein LguiB_010037 [Lonicera macranthoides]